MQDAIDSFKRGELVVLTNGKVGHLVMAAEKAESSKIAFVVRNTTGLLKAPLSALLATRLQLPVTVDTLSPALTSTWTISVDSVELPLEKRAGAAGRAETLRLLADPSSTTTHFSRPGHVFPVVGIPGGLLGSKGNNEAALELCSLAGAQPVAVIAELVSETDGSVMSALKCEAFAQKYDLKHVTIDQIVEHVQSVSNSPGLKSEEEISASRGVELIAECNLPVHLRGRALGTWKLKCFYSHFDGRHHVVMVKGDVQENPDEPVLTRVHSECFTGDILGSERCDCGEQLFRSMDMICAAGRGVLIYNVGHEGRGIGLANKIMAYHLQQTQMIDTYQANRALGLPDDLRSYDTAISIMHSLGLKKVRLLTSNTIKITAFGDLVTCHQPLEGTENPHNHAYLSAKRMRHNSPDVSNIDYLAAALQPASSLA